MNINVQTQLANLDFSQMDEKYISYLLLHSGYVTGYIRFGGLQAVIPNKETYRTFMDVFLEWGK